jgi:hypothetical protein
VAAMCVKSVIFQCNSNVSETTFETKLRIVGFLFDLPSELRFSMINVY